MKKAETRPVSLDSCARRNRRWGVVLAGGDGLRLQTLTRFVSGDDRPKQFCPLFGEQTLLGQTLQRAELTIPREQVLASLAGYHCQFYLQEPALRPSQRIVQPMNKGTAPPIIHSLLSIAGMDEQALVAILPSDHHYSNERSFNVSLNLAFEAAAEETNSVVLLGASPGYPEVEYGWIELGGLKGRRSSQLYRVRGFREKPRIRAARALFAQGAVWNTFVMVGHVQAFLEMIRETTPDLLEEISRARLWQGEETHIEYSLYTHFSTSSFSHEVLSAETKRLLTLRLNDAGWSDLGAPMRVTSVVGASGSVPAWFQRWSSGKKAASQQWGSRRAIA